METILTTYTQYCAFCGKPTENSHHLLFGKGIRPLAEEDGIKLPICARCHTAGNVKERIHDNMMAEKLSKVCGQLAWEKRKVAEGFTEEKARELFRYRYGRSYL